MTTDIQETINRLRELDRYASPAPWSSQRGFISTGLASLDITNDKQGFPLMRLWADMTKGDREVNPQDDFTLIIETRNALPAILAEIDRLQKSERALKDRFARIFNTWRSRRPELIRKNRAEAWEEGYTEGLLSGRRLERTGVELPHSNPYEK